MISAAMLYPEQHIAYNTQHTATAYPAERWKNEKAKEKNQQTVGVFQVTLQPKSPSKESTIKKTKSKEDRMNIYIYTYIIYIT